LSGAPLMFGMLMDAHHPGWVFIGIGRVSGAVVDCGAGVGEQAGKRQVQAA